MIRRRIVGRVILGLFLAIVLLTGVKSAFLVSATLQVQRDARALQDTVGALTQDSTSRKPMAQLPAQMSALSASLDSLQSEVRPLEPLLRATRLLPPDGSWLSSVPDLLTFGTSTARVGAVVAQPLSSVDLSPEAQGGRLPQLLAATTTLAPQVPAMKRELSTARTSAARLQNGTIDGPLAALKPAIDLSVKLLPQVEEALDLLSVARPALGMEGRRTYLLLGQNNHEIRATGGFIGSAGMVTVENGAIAGLEYGSSYTIDAGVQPPAPPVPMARYLGLGGWYLRDANWWPDFPATAAQIEQAWLLAGRQSVDGVIAFDLTAMETLFRFAGPLDVPGFGLVSADNFERVAAEQFYSKAALQGQKSFDSAKNAFFGALGPVLVSELLAISPASLPGLAKEMETLLSEKHVLLAFKDAGPRQMVHDRGWDGAVPRVDGDSLFVVDTTVSYGDTYPFVDTSVDLRISTYSEGWQLHELLLNYVNHYPRGLPSWSNPTMVGASTFDQSSGVFRMNPGFWGNWLRLYLPHGAEIVQVSGLADQPPPREEFGRSLVAGYLPVPPGQTRSVTIQYLTRFGYSNDNEPYRLFVQKQAGLGCRAISVAVTWPNGQSHGREACVNRDGWIEIGEQH